jgi:hypothetical protein
MFELQKMSFIDVGRTQSVMTVEIAEIEREE